MFFFYPFFTFVQKRLVRLVGLFVFFYTTEKEGEGGEEAEPEGRFSKKVFRSICLCSSASERRILRAILPSSF